MIINIKSLKFDADQKLLDYVGKKVTKLERFFDNATNADVTLSLVQEPENKSVKILVHVPGEDLVIERKSTTFEQAVTEAVDAMKEKLVRTKEKRFEK